MNAPSSHPPRLNLTATPRPSETEGNLFVRLTPRTVWKLASFLFPASPSHDDGRNDFVEASSQEVPAIDFLPLEITVRQPSPLEWEKVEDGDEDADDIIVVYASYNGGAPATPTYASGPYGSVNKDDIIELPLDLHPSLQSIFKSTSEPVLVSVRPLSNVPIGERVTFEPLTISDWEMIEMEAAVLEDGGLLNQITVVSPGQVFPLRFGGHLGGFESAAWIRVVDDFSMPPNEPLDVDGSEESDASFASGSDSEFDSSIDSSIGEEKVSLKNHVGIYSHQCVRLMAETEVAVIPKLRVREGDTVEKEKSNDLLSDGPVYCPSPPLRVQPTFTDVPHSVFVAEESPLLPDPPLGSVCVHPSTLIQLPGYGQCHKTLRQSEKQGRLQDGLPPLVVTIRRANGPYAMYSPPHEGDKGWETSCQVVIATLHASNCMHEGHIGMHSLLRYQLGVLPLDAWVSLQIWTESHVMNSINDVRQGSENIGIEKVSITTSSAKLSLRPWEIPDGYRDVPSPTRGMDHSICEHCSENNTGEEGKTLQSAVAMGEDVVCNPALLFTSGSIVPVELLQNLGLDSLGHHSHHMSILILRPKTGPSINSTKRNGCLPPDTSQIVPIFTVKDLTKLSCTEQTNVNLFETQGLSLVLPFSEKSTAGFAHAIQGVMQSARELISHRPKSEASPVFLASESVHEHAIMITGEEGSGKSHLAMTVSSKLSLSDSCGVVYLDCKKLQTSSSSIQFILEEIQKSFQKAMHKQPSLLVLDDLDALIPNVESSGTEGDGSIHHQQLNPLLAIQTKIIVDHLLIQSQHCHKSARLNNLTKSTGVILICTCQGKDYLSTRYQGSGVFHSLVEVPCLDSSQRAQFLRSHVFGNASVSSEDGISHVISLLAKDMDGFRPRDLQIVATRILHQNYLRNFNKSPELDGCSVESEPRKSFLERLESDIATIMEDYAPLSQKLVHVDRNLCSMDWASIGGLSQAKQSLHDIIIHPMKFKRVYDNAPMELPFGVLLYGPPGCGKSFIAPLLAKKSKLNLITCRGPELLDRYIGASEAKVRQLFVRATAAAPAMIFFDEFDSLAPQRGSDHTGVTDRVVNQLLTLLDGADRSKKASHIFVVAATSRPDKIDKALLRPGRLEKHVYVGYPETPIEWNSLFSSLLKTRDVDEEVSCLQQGGDLFNSFCKDFEYAKDFSAADLKAVLDTAHLLRVHEILDANNETAHDPAILGKRHILEAFRRTRPSMLPKERYMLQNIYSSFGSNRTEEDPSVHPNDRGLKTSLR